MHKCSHMRFAALLCALALPLSAAAQEAPAPPTGTSDLSYGLRQSANPVVGQEDRRLVLEAASSGHRRHRYGWRHWRRNRVRLAAGHERGFTMPRPWSTYRRYWSLEGEAGRRSLSKRTADRGVRRSARHGPSRLLRHRQRRRPGQSICLPATRNHARHAWMDPSASRRSTGRQRRGIHARARYG